MKTSAILSSDRIYRYALYRVWDLQKPIVLFIGLNPSTADETANDPTIIRCIGFAQDWGYGGLIMANLFAYRSTDPSNLKKTLDPVGPENNEWLKKLGETSEIVIAAWGTKGTYLGRDVFVKNLFKNIHYLELSKDGHPKHPLYLKRTLIPKKME